MVSKTADEQHEQNHKEFRKLKKYLAQLVKAEGEERKNVKA
jgi:hypothetical protein